MPHEKWEGLAAEANSLFDTLWNEVVWLGDVWAQHYVLFQKSKDDHDLAYATAGGFFEVLRLVLAEYVCLGIGRLTDPSRTGGHKNLSLLRLVEYLQEEDACRGAGLAALYGREVEPRVRKIREYRNKWVAHRDLEHALEQRANGEGRAYGVYRDVSEALEAIQNFLNAVLEAHGSPRFAFELRRPVSLGSAPTLLEALRLRQLVVEKCQTQELPVDLCGDLFTRSRRNDPDPSS